jgi:hypothetical protein
MCHRLVNCIWLTVIFVTRAQIDDGEVEVPEAWTEADCGSITCKQRQCASRVLVFHRCNGCCTTVTTELLPLLQSEVLKGAATIAEGLRSQTATKRKPLSGMQRSGSLLSVVEHELLPKHKAMRTCSHQRNALQQATDDMM